MFLPQGSIWAHPAVGGADGCSRSGRCRCAAQFIRIHQNRGISRRLLQHRRVCQLPLLPANHRIALHAVLLACTACRGSMPPHSAITTLLEEAACTSLSRSTAHCQPGRSATATERPKHTAPSAGWHLPALSPVTVQVAVGHSCTIGLSAYGHTKPSVEAGNAALAALARSRHSRHTYLHSSGGRKHAFMRLACGPACTAPRDQTRSAGPSRHKPADPAHFCTTTLAAGGVSWMVAVVWLAGSTVWINASLRTCGQFSRATPE